MGTDKLEYTLIRSDRRTVSLAVTPEGLVVRAPLRLPKHAVDEFVESRRDWIATHTARMEARQKELSSIEPLTEPELRALAEEALKVIPERAAHYAPWWACAATASPSAPSAPAGEAVRPGGI